MKIRQGKKGSDESRTRLRNRSNQLFDHEGINEHGNRFYRRNPNKEFKPDPTKPGEGSAIVNHEKGKMLTAKQITADQTAGKTLNPYLNGDGFQLRLAEAIRIAKKLCRPKVKRNKRIKGKNGNPSQLRVDRRLRWALVNLRRLRKAHIAFDQWLYPELGAFPVYEDQRKIKYICLGDSSENETAKRKAHPDGFMGTEIKNKKRDSAKKLLSVLNFLRPCFELGNKKGDAKRFDPKGIIKIEKTDVESDGGSTPSDTWSETETTEEESDEDNEVPEAELAATETGVPSEGETGLSPASEHSATEIAAPEENPEQAPLGGEPEVKEPATLDPESDSEIEILVEIPQKPKPAPEIIDVESTQNQVKIEPKPEPGVTENDPQDLEGMRAHIQHLTNLLKLQTEKQANEAVVTKKEPEEDTPVPCKRETGEEEEPKTTEPQSDTDEVIQNLENYCANNDTENQQTPKTNKEAQAESAQSKDSEEENSGIETRESSSQEDEIVVDPTTLTIDEGEAPVNSTEATDASNNNATQPKPTETQSKAAPVQAKCNRATNEPDRKVIVYDVPITFPAGGNLMEYPRTSVFITEALTTTMQDVLPGNAIVHASLRHQMVPGQSTAAVVVELISPGYHDEVVRRIRKWYANEKTPRKEKYRFHVTDFPQKTGGAQKKSKKKRKPSKEEEKPDHKRRRRGSREPSTSKETKSPKRDERSTKKTTKPPEKEITKPSATDRETPEEEKIRIYKERRKAIKEKLAHQDKETQNLIDRKAFGYKDRTSETGTQKLQPQKHDKSKSKSAPKASKEPQKEKPPRSPKPGSSGKQDVKKDKERPSNSSKPSSLWESPGALAALVTPKPSAPKPSTSGTPKTTNSGPKAVTSTPMPGAPKIDPNASSDTLENLDQPDPKIASVTRVEAESSSLDTSKLDMAMTVEVENDLYTPPNPDNPNDEETEEIGRQASAHKSRLDTVKRWAENPNDEDLRTSMRNQTIGSLDLRYRLKAIKKKSRHNSGPADLRNSVLNRNRDLRDIMRPRRNRSTPPEVQRDNNSVLEEIKLLQQSIVQQTHHLNSNIKDTRKRLRQLENSIMNQDTKSESDHNMNLTSATESIDSDLESEGEVHPSEDELLNVKYSDERPEPSEPTKSKKKISPIKFPTNTPSKNAEDVPLSKVIPRNAPPTRDLRHRIEGNTSPDPFNRGPIRERLNIEQPPRQNNPPHQQNVWPSQPQTRPWMPFLQEQRPENHPRNYIDPWIQPEDNRTSYDTAHHSRHFMERQYTSRDESTMTDQELETPDRDTTREGNH